MLKAVAAGLSARQAAARYQIGIATAIVWVRRARCTGETAARRQGPPRGIKPGNHMPITGLDPPDLRAVVSNLESLK